jgi:hypothetical protein
MEDRAMIMFLAGALAALASSTILLAWILWWDGVGDDPDQKTARVVPLVGRQPKSSGQRAKSALASQTAASPSKTSHPWIALVQQEGCIPIR